MDCKTAIVGQAGINGVIEVATSLDSVDKSPLVAGKQTERPYNV